MGARGFEQAIWTPDRIDFLKTSWAAGYSGGEIAAHLKCTRSAVLGKLKRLKLLGTRPHLATSPRTPNPRKRTPKPTKPLTLVASMPKPSAPPPEGGVTFLDLRPGQCRWPLGEPTDPFCGGGVDGDCPYCAKHRAVAYRPATAAERRAERRVAA